MLEMFAAWLSGAVGGYIFGWYMRARPRCTVEKVAVPDEWDTTTFAEAAQRTLGARP